MAPTPTLPRKPGEGEDALTPTLSRKPGEGEERAPARDLAPPVRPTSDVFIGVGVTGGIEGGNAYANLGPRALPILPQN